MCRKTCAICVMVVFILCSVAMTSRANERDVISKNYDYYDISYTDYEDGIMITDCYLHKPVTCFEVPEYIDGKRVVAIGTGAFAYFQGFNNQFVEYYAEEIVLPDSIRILEDNALGAVNIYRLTLPPKLEKIGISALPRGRDGRDVDVVWKGDTERYYQIDGFIVERFTGTAVYCFSPSKSGTLTIPEGIVEIQDGLFRLERMKKVIFPKSLRIIDYAAFAECTELEEVIFQENLVKIGAFAFNECSNIKELHFPPSLLYIGNAAFFQETLEGPGALETIDLNDGLVYIGENAFANHYTGYISVPESVVYVGSSAFATDLEDFILDGWVEESW